MSTMHIHISMIFRTITDESTGATKSIGLFGKSLSELKTIIYSVKSKGIINTIFNTSTIDKTAVEEYNCEIEQATANGATMAEKQQIINATMKGTNKATAQLRRADRPDPKTTLAVEKRKSPACKPAKQRPRIRKNPKRHRRMAGNGQRPLHCGRQYP